MSLISLVETVLGRSKKTSGNNMSFKCPLCNHYKHKLEVDLSTQYWHCWVCNAKGRKLYTLFKKVGASIAQLKDLATQTDSYVPVKATAIDHVTLPIEFQLILNGNKTNPEFRNALMYLKNRGITREDIVRYGIGYCESGPYDKMIIIPSYDKDGRLNFFTGRSYYKDSTFKHKNPKVSKDIIGFELFINWNEPITIVEGAFDAIAVKRNAIPLFGKIILDNLKKQIIEHNVKNIYIALDTDARKKALDICQYFIDNGINVYLIELGDKDPSDLGYRDMLNKKQITSNITGSSLMLKKLGSMFE
jgi:DNA primase